MKKYRVAIMAFLAVFFFASCDEDLIDDLFDVEESFSFSIELPVIADESEYSVAHVFNLSEEVDLINEYGNLIKSVNLDQVYFHIVEFEGDIDITVDAGSLYVLEVDGSNKQLITHLGQLNLSELVDNPTELELNEAGVNLLGELAKNPPHSFMLEYELQLEEEDVPVIFTAEFEFTATMVANPLN